MKMSKFLTRRYSFLGASLMQNVWKDYERCMDVTGVADCARDVECVNIDWYLDETWMEDVSKRHVGAAPDLFRRFLRRGEDAGGRLAEASRELYEDIDAVGAAVSGKRTREFLAWRKLFQDNAAFILITHPLARSVETRLMEILGKYGVPAKDFDQMLLDLSITRKSNGAEEENFDLFFIQRHMNDPGYDLEGALAQHARRHAYLKYRDPFSGGHPVAYFRERLKEKLSLPDYFRPYADILGRFDEGEQEICELLEEFVYFRTFRTERSYESLYYLERFLAALEEAHGLEAHELSFYSEDEFVRFLETGARLDRARVEERMGGFALLMRDGAVSILTGGAARRWRDMRNAGEDRAVREVRGLTAFRGSAVGRARIVMSADMQDVVQEGDILVVTMTTPDFLPGMRRAAALVTDEGGVICHAAIIARELKKPCVIGTRKATSVFKDGDLVEVDGFKGVVRLARS